MSKLKDWRGPELLLLEELLMEVPQDGTFRDRIAQYLYEEILNERKLREPQAA